MSRRRGGPRGTFWLGFNTSTGYETPTIDDIVKVTDDWEVNKVSAITDEADGIVRVINSDGSLSVEMFHGTRVIAIPYTGNPVAGEKVEVAADGLSVQPITTGKQVGIKVLGFNPIRTELDLLV